MLRLSYPSLRTCSAGQSHTPSLRRMYFRHGKRLVRTTGPAAEETSPRSGNNSGGGVEAAGSLGKEYDPTRKGGG